MLTQNSTEYCANAPFQEGALAIVARPVEVPSNEYAPPIWPFGS
jgi:hypothetical protein